MTQTLTALADAREQFLSLVNGLRPELHRYCARLTGSVIEGEDIVQDTLAKAFYALSLSAVVRAALACFLWKDGSRLRRTLPARISPLISSWSSSRMVE